MEIALVIIILVGIVFVASYSQIESENNAPGSAPNLYSNMSTNTSLKWKKGELSKLPKDFSFSLSWRINGIGAYDSTAGILYQPNENKPDEYKKLPLVLDEDRQRAVGDILNHLDLANYPENLCPAGTTEAQPINLSLTVRAGEEEKRIYCRGIESGYVGDTRLTAYIDACCAIIGIITSAMEHKVQTA